MKNIILFLCLLLLSPSFAFAGPDDGRPWLEPGFYMVNSGMRQMNWGYDMTPFAQGQTTADDGDGFFNSAVDGFDYPWFFETRMRPHLTFHGHERLSGHLQMELNSAWGRESSVGSIQYGDGYTGKLRFRQYWVNAQLGNRQDRPVNVKLGRQDFSTMNGVVVGLPMMEGLSINGLLPPSAGSLWLGSAMVDTRSTLEVKNTWHSLRFKPHPFGRFQSVFYASYLHINDDAVADENYYKDPLSYNKAPQLTNGSWIMGRGLDGEPTLGVADVFWLGAQTSGVIGAFFVNAHAIVDFASFAQGDTSQAAFTGGAGMFFDCGITYDTGLFGIGPSFLFTSGHNGDQQADSYSGFLAMTPDVGFTRMFFDGAPIFNVFGHDDASVTGSGLMAIKLNTFYRVGPDTRLNCTLAFLGSHKNRPQMPDASRGLAYAEKAAGSGKYYGTELNLWLDWGPLDGVNFTAEFDALLPGSYYQGDDNNGFATDPDMAYRILLSSQVAF